MNPLCLLLVIGLATTSAGADDETLVLLRQESHLYVQQGDTLLTLFGEDWHTVWKRNPITVFSHGRVIESPDRILVGQRLAIPAGTRVTPKAMERIQQYQAITHSALRAIERAKNAQAHLADSAMKASPLYQMGTEWLCEAKQLASTESNGGGNLQFAKQRAAEAEMLFSALQQHSVPKPAIKKAHVSAHQIVPIVIATIMGVLIGGVFWRRRRSVGALPEITPAIQRLMVAYRAQQLAFRGKTPLTPSQTATEAEMALQRAENALQQGDVAKMQKHADKAMRLYHAIITAQAHCQLKQLKAFGGD